MRYRFLFTALPTNDLGLLTRLMAVAAALKDRGHEVMFSHPAPVPRQLLQKGGFRTLLPRHPLLEVGFYGFSWRKLFSREVSSLYRGVFRFLLDLIRCYPYRKAAVTHEVWDQDHASAITGMLNFHFNRAQFEAYVGVIRESKADAIIDAWNPFACIAARYLGKPLVTVNQGDALPDAKGFIWWKRKPSGVPTVVPVINMLLRTLDLPLIKRIEDLNKGDLSLVTGIPETDPLETLEGYKYVGPLIWESSGRSSVPVLDRKRPAIWLYGGNLNYGGNSRIFDSRQMVEACLEALTGMDLQVVLTTGYHAKDVIRRKMPPNFHCVEYVPALVMVQSVDLMIHHGGYTSCQVGLLSGTPSLILPTFSERESNARRIVSIGAGEMVLPRAEREGWRFDVEEIRRKTRQLLSDTRWKNNARDAGMKLAAAGGPAFAADLIEGLMSARVGE